MHEIKDTMRHFYRQYYFIDLLKFFQGLVIIDFFFKVKFHKSTRNESWFMYLSYEMKVGVRLMKSKRSNPSASFTGITVSQG